MADHARAARMAKRIQTIVATAIEREIKDRRLELAPGGTDIVDEQAGDGIVECVEDPHNGQDHAGRAKHPQRQAQNIRQKVQ